MATPEIGTPQSGGMATLQVAVAHLEMIHQAIDAVDSKAMFYVGLNFVGLGIFVGALGPLEWSVWAAVAPGVLTLIVGCLGAWALWPRDVAQFPAPDVMAEYEGAGYNDDQLAWMYLDSITEATKQAGGLNALKVQATYAMFGFTVLHIVAVFASATAFAA